MAQAQSRDELRILLVGKTGSGKSATGNSILGEKVFLSRLSTSSTTEKCRKGKSTQGGREIIVIDTPGFFDTEKKAFTESDARAWIQELYPGPHAILLVVKLGRMTKQENDSFWLAKKLFSGGEHFMILLFTHKDVLDHDGITLPKFLEAADEDLKELMAAADNRCFAINNIAEGEEKSQQVAQLIDMIDSLARNNGKNRAFYSEEMFENIRKIEKLEKENEDLKKQVEEWKKLAKQKEEQNEGNNRELCSVERLENIQKIERLEKEIEKLRKQNESILKCILM